MREKYLKHKKYYIYLLLFILLLLPGCVSDGYAHKQNDEMVEKGRMILEEYVNSLSEEANITNISMLNGGKRGEPSFNASLPSHIIQAAFKVNDRRYIAIVNLEDGEVYSNYDYIDPNELIQRQLVPYLDEYGFNGTYEVSGAFYSYAFVSHQVEVNKGDIKDVYVYIDNIPDLIPVENADEFMNASISGFDIAYESENDEVFNPEILYEYLVDTGNYRKEDMRGDNREYRIKGGRQKQNFVNGEPAYFDVNIISEGSPDTMTCDVMRWDYMEDEDFSYLYVGGEKKGKINDIEKAEYIYYNCPFSFSSNEITFEKNDNSPYEGYLYIKNPNWDEIIMTRYMLTNKALDEKTNDIVDRWEFESVGQDELEIVKSESSDLFELYIKGTNDKCEFTDDKAVILFK